MLEDCKFSLMHENQIRYNKTIAVFSELACDWETSGRTRLFATTALRTVHIIISSALKRL